MRAKTWLCSGTIQNWRADKPITRKVVWEGCRIAATRAQLDKRVSPHLLRHYLPFLTMSGPAMPSPFSHDAFTAAPT
jgi:integrase/recombinase XerD